MENFSRQRKSRIVRCGILTVLIMIMIFIFSSMDAAHSGAVSGFLANFIDSLKLGELLPDIANQVSTEGRLRKLAHITIYFMLGLSNCAMFQACFFQRAADGDCRIDSVDILKALLCSVTFSFLYACSDEWHQTFVSGRSGKFSDVGVDAIGFVSAAIVSIMITCLMGKTEKNSGGSN